jgi:hypothetical protein
MTYARGQAARGGHVTEHEDLFGSLHESIAAEADRHLTVMLDLGDDEVERYVRSVIASVVLGTFSDPSHPEGIGALLIKGREITHVMRETRRMPAGHGNPLPNARTGRSHADDVGRRQAMSTNADERERNHGGRRGQA